MRFILEFSGKCDATAYDGAITGDISGAAPTPGVGDTSGLYALIAQAGIGLIKKDPEFDWPRSGHRN
jgi:hypothetical protein